MPATRVEDRLIFQHLSQYTQPLPVSPGATVPRPQTPLPGDFRGREQDRVVLFLSRLSEVLIEKGVLTSDELCQIIRDVSPKAAMAKPPGSPGPNPSLPPAELLGY
jgi:hypothetical protein